MATKSQHSSSYKKLPAFFRQLREEAGLTQRELGKRLSRPQSWVYNCETGNRRCDISEAILIFRALGLDEKKTFAKMLKELF